MLLCVQTLQAQSQLTMTVTALERKLGAINEENQVRSTPKDRARTIAWASWLICWEGYDA